MKLFSIITTSLIVIFSSSTSQAKVNLKNEAYVESFFQPPERHGQLWRRYGKLTYLENSDWLLPMTKMPGPSTARLLLKSLTAKFSGETYP